MKLLCVFINSVFGDYCCFDYWTEWQQSSLTCGRVCKERQRDVMTGVSGYFESHECNYDYTPCPWSDWQEASCVSNNCRKFDFRIVSLYIFVAINFYSFTCKLTFKRN